MTGERSRSGRMDVQRRRPRRDRRDRRDRRGAVAVIVALLLVVLVGFSAFAIDFGQTFVFRAQLQTAADAGAMAGALELLHGRPTLAPDSATTYAAHNRVSTVNATADSVIPGNFSDATGFVPRGSWTDADVNAVRVTTVHEAPYTFAPVLGLATRTVRASAIGAVGSTTRAACMKPWAVPMSNVLYTLGKTGENPETYQLTDEDIATLRDNRKLIAFKISTQDSTGAIYDVATGTAISGNYYAVQFGPYRADDGSLYDPGPTGGGKLYKERITGACASGGVTIGDWLYVENGNMVGPTKQGTGELCAVKGGGSGFECDPAVEIDIPIWNRFDGHKEVQIAYIGKFMVTRFDNGSVFGYLTARATDGGGFSGTPGPTQTAALVR